MSPLVVPVYLEALSFATTSQLTAEVGELGSWASLTTFTVAGVEVTRSLLNSLFYVKRYVGETNIPGDVRRLRASTQQLMRRMGQPVIIKHMFTDRDVALGIAMPSPVYDKAYGQTRNRDPYSYGTGFCSRQLSPDEWVDPNTGAIVTSDTQPDPTFVQAPMYRGYGPGFLTYIIEPDVPLDIFKLSAAGALTKVQSQTVVSGWFPEINDNDLIVNVELDDAGYVSATKERYQAKITRPISIRGMDRHGRREYSADHGNRHVINQQFEMSLVPELSVLMLVETDR